MRALAGAILVAGVPSGEPEGGGRVGGPVAPGAVVVAPPAANAPTGSTSSGQAVTGGTGSSKTPVVVAPVQPEQVPVAAGEMPKIAIPRAGEPVPMAAGEMPEIAAPRAGEPELTPTAGGGERPAATPRVATVVTPQGAPTKVEAGVQPTAAEVNPTAGTGPAATRPARKAAALATPTERAEDSGCQIVGGPSGSRMAGVLVLIGIVLGCLRGRRDRT